MNEFTGLFWLLSGALALLAAAFVAIPVWRARRGAGEAGETDRAEANIALFRERKQELEADFAAGEIDREELDSLLIELQKSLLSDVESAEQPRRVTDHEASDRESSGRKDSDSKNSDSNSNDREAISWRSPASLAPLSLILLLPLAAWLMYQQWGQLEDVELMDQFQRTVQNENDMEAARDLVLSLGQVVRENPERSWAWYFLGENFSTLGMFDVANSAYRQAAERLREDDEKALALGRVVLTAYIMEQLRITPEIQQLIDSALELNPDEPNVLQLLASDAREREDYDAAIGYWRRLSQLNPDSQLARQNIADLQRLRAMDTGSSILGDTASGIAGDSASDAAADGPAIEVAVSIADDLPLAPQLRVFVSARNAQVDGIPPLAVADLSVADLPARIRLDNSLAVGPFNLSLAESVYVSALVSQTGTANRTPGDYYAETEAFSLESPPRPVELVISEIVP